MKSRKGNLQNPFYIESNQVFRQALLNSLAKLNDNATHKTGFDEIRDLLMNHVQDSERLSLVLTSVAEQNEFQKISTKKETIKVIGLMAEVFEDRLVEFFPRILALVTKRLKENDGQVHQVLSETMGSVVGFGLKNLPTEQTFKQVNLILKTLYSQFSAGNKYIQTGAAMCITKVIQSSPVECLHYLSNDLTLRIIELLKLPNCKAHLQLFEGILSLILAVEENLPKLVENSKLLLPVVIDNMANPDWNVRKISIEVVYTLSVLVKDVLALYKNELLEVLNHCRFDKIKNVRDIAVSAINAIKDLKETPQKDDGNRLNLSSNIESIRLRPESANNRWLENKRESIEIEQEPKNKNDPQQFVMNVSPKGTKSREINPNFFKNSKGKGDIEIRVKSPPKQLQPVAQTAVIDLNANNNKDNEPIQYETLGQQSFDFERQRINNTSSRVSPDLGKENTDSVQSRRNQTSSGPKLLQSEAIKQKNAAIAEKFPVSENLPATSSVPLQTFLNNTNTDDNQRIVQANYLQPNENTTYQESTIRQRDASNNSNIMQPEVSNRLLASGMEKKSQPQPRDSEGGGTDGSPQKELTKEELHNISKQLKKINKQQTKLVDSITNFQLSTQNEITFLKNKILYLEEAFEKSFKQFPPQFFGPPNNYSYPNPLQQLPGRPLNQMNEFPFNQNPVYNYGQQPDFRPPQYQPYQPYPNYNIQNNPFTNSSLPTHTANFSKDQFSGIGLGNNTKSNQNQSPAGPFSMSSSQPYQNDFSGSFAKYNIKPLNVETFEIREEKSMPITEVTPTTNKKVLSGDSTVKAAAGHIYSQNQIFKEKESFALQAHGEKNIWDTIQTHLHNGLINDAFKIGLKEGDDYLILRLLNETVEDIQFLNPENLEMFLKKFHVTLNSPQTRLPALKWIEKLTTSNQKLPKQMVDHLVGLLGELVNKYGDSRELLPEEIELINRSADNLNKVNEQGLSESNNNVDEYSYWNGMDSLDDNKKANY